MAALQNTGLSERSLTSSIPQLLTTIPWGHHLQLITKCKSLQEALFYIDQATKNGWSNTNNK
ncbi:MAG: DUF1016 N-terminal domain-containing protein [Flavisolibacter sp.]